MRVWGPDSCALMHQGEYNKRLPKFDAKPNPNPRTMMWMMTGHGQGTTPCDWRTTDEVRLLTVTAIPPITLTLPTSTTVTVMATVTLVSKMHVLST